MANIKSQIKRIKQDQKRHLRNKSVKSSVKTTIRRFHEAAESGDREEITTRAHAACRALDKAAGKGVIHKNQAANKKSAVTRKLNALETAAS